MADSRILHKAAGDSEKVSALSDLEYRVWTQYILSADDYGVMLASAHPLQSDNRALRQRPTRAVQKALDAVIAAGLVMTFVHQGERYVWQPDWNDRQGIRYPRATIKPLPPDTSAATKATLKLFGYRADKAPEDFGEVAEISQTPVGAGGRETLTQTPTQAQTQTPEGSARETKPPDHGGGEWRQRSTRRGLMHSPIQHSGCYPSHGCGRGLCVPRFVADEWLGQCSGDSAYVGTFIANTLKFIPAGPQGDPAKFWRAQWDAKHRTPIATTKAARTMAAGDRVAAMLEQGVEIDPFGLKADARAKALAEKAGA